MRGRRRQRHEDNGSDGNGRRHDDGDSGDDEDDNCGGGGRRRRWWPEAATAAEECSGVCRRAVAEGRQKIAKAIWRFHPPARRHVFDAVLKHGWPSTPCHGASMAEKKKLKPLHCANKRSLFYTQRVWTPWK